ncbi:hypothetical protein GEMRC1_008427 [Eukaryota sp. GEM-RC1]
MLELSKINFASFDPCFKYFKRRVIVKHSFSLFKTDISSTALIPLCIEENCKICGSKTLYGDTFNDLEQIPDTIVDSLLAANSDMTHESDSFTTDSWFLRPISNFVVQQCSIVPNTSKILLLCSDETGLNFISIDLYSDHVLYHHP